MLTVILLLVSLAVLLQALSLLGVWQSIRKLEREVEGIRADVKQHLDPISRSIADIMGDSREPVRTIVANLAEISRVLRERASQVDRVVSDVVDKSRLQIIRVDQMVSQLMEKVESTAEVVRREILAPIQEVTAVMKGLRSGLEFLFSRRRASRASETTQDEQMFI